ncbi:3-deoxy-D-arabinoheptulosonate-7-phosphate synthase [Saccharothrix saharensis]|uniref:Phospho-2-dehydro-3-deoxyheptonate aldolase n=1 Tax=Saccharothrix saharensis TaxID=571190 RepID=A0A543J729_9PSEU|nr:3-deoxy-7-phosphoheptulonate synthase [Saccharothrix saharensis]TQM78640.1 3-deoxy-D-arabinoheptulosonate-7-phosphate synthase [Saccharothrix saharensis]
MDLMDRVGALPGNEIRRRRSLPAAHQPAWDAEAAAGVGAALAGMPGLVEVGEVRRLGALLAEVAAGRAQVVQAGDCAEDPAECGAGDLARKVGLLDAVAGAMAAGAGVPVIRVGRFAGQFAKPRSAPVERVNGVELPVYAGHMVNSPEPDPELRRPDPNRMLSCYTASRSALAFLRGPSGDHDVWSSHEALVLDYELAMLRRDGDGDTVLGSTHWPWIGERTRRPDGAHVDLLASVVNPVACKVGPAASTDDVLALCARLDPHRTPGRLTLISRMGADVVADRLPALVAAVRAQGHPVIWLCDPMHANTVTNAEGLKSRLLTAITREVRSFRVAVAGAGGVAGGLHLETTPDDVTECAADEAGLADVGAKYTTLCDPRLNPGQAVAVAAVWGE